MIKVANCDDTGNAQNADLYQWDAILLSPPHKQRHNSLFGVGCSFILFSTPFSSSQMNTIFLDLPVLLETQASLAFH